jgi:hypothetical protein
MGIEGEVKEVLQDPTYEVGDSEGTQDAEIQAYDENRGKYEDRDDDEPKPEVVFLQSITKDGPTPAPRPFTAPVFSLNGYLEEGQSHKAEHHPQKEGY